MDRIKKWTGENKIIVLYFVYAVVIEMLCVYSVEKNPIITRPYIELGLLIVITCVGLFLKSNRARYIYSIIFLILESVINLVMIIIYDMTGQYFDYGMIKLRNDAFGVLESVPVRFVPFYGMLFMCLIFITLTNRIVKKDRKFAMDKTHIICYLMGIIIGLSMFIVAIIHENIYKIDKYEMLLTNEQKGIYSSYGIVGNILNESAKGIVFNDSVELPKKKIDKYIYKEVSVPTSNFGISKDKNVVVILTESLEWFPFINSDEFKNTLGLSDDDIRKLLPNLTKFYNQSVVMRNFHSKEKTDISETYSILGSYPSDKYIAYDYPENILPQTLPNILRNISDEDIQIRSYHNGYKEFYNRIFTHSMFGFDKLVDSYDMYEMSDKNVENGLSKTETMHDYMNEGERNLDSEMIDTCKDDMFPTDKRFYTYITTITMHGIYYERENLSSHYKEFEKYYTPTYEGNEDVTEEQIENENVLKDYFVTVMEFDKALGIMMDDLKEKNLLDSTTIVLFGDHNAYYQELSNYVKDIYGYDTENNYTDLYNVPLMIYDTDLDHEEIDKFVCTADIVPTMMDLLGIRYYSNLYFGNSVFSSEKSVLYSRAYGFFLDEGIVARSVNSILYQNSKVTDEDLKEFADNAKILVTKLKYCDQIFYQDYFGKKNNYNKFIENMKYINSY